MLPKFFKGSSKKVDDTFGLGGTTTTSTFGRWGVPDTTTMTGPTDTMELRSLTVGNGKVQFDADEDESNDCKRTRNRDDLPDRVNVKLDPFKL